MAPDTSPTPRPRRSHTGTLLRLALLLSAAGCGGDGKRNVVEGTVKWNGSRANGNCLVTFIGANNQRKVGLVNAEGRYEIEQPPAGTVKVTVQELPPSRAPSLDKDQKKIIPAPKAEAPSNLPKKYADPDNGLTF